MKHDMICLVRFTFGVKHITISMQRIKDLLVNDPWSCLDLVYDSWMCLVMGCDLVCVHWTWVVTSMRCLDKVVLSMGCGMLGQSVVAFHRPRGNVAEIFKPLSMSLGASLESRLSPCSWLLRLGSTPNEAKGGRPYQVTKENYFSMMMLNWDSCLGVLKLTINNHIWQDEK